MVVAVILCLVIEVVWVKTYRCSGKKSGKTCSSHIILESNLVKKIFEEFNELMDLINPKIDTETQSSTGQVQELESELATIEKSLNKHKKMYERDIIDIDELVEKTEQLREREKITNELKNYKRVMKIKKISLYR